MSRFFDKKFKAALEDKNTPPVVLLYWFKTAQMSGCTNNEWAEALTLLKKKRPALVERLNELMEESSLSNPFMSVFYPHLFFNNVMSMEKLKAEFDLARSQAVQEKHILQAYTCFKYFFPRVEEELDF